ncbi:MAG TPA: glutaredoxin family protein [Actinomycetota bacterium]|nr:glutaredoxin family protein [Actinomycetota bacterium]
MTRVTLLTKPDCGFCDQAQQTLDRLGREFDLTVEVVPLESEAGRALAAGSGMAFPPGVLLDGQPFSYGRLSERKLRRVLESSEGR